MDLPRRREPQGVSHQHAAAGFGKASMVTMKVQDFVWTKTMLICDHFEQFAHSEQSTPFYRRPWRLLNAQLIGPKFPKVAVRSVRAVQARALTMLFRGSNPFYTLLYSPTNTLGQLRTCHRSNVFSSYTFVWPSIRCMAPGRPFKACFL